MMELIFSDYIYVLIFYIFVCIPLYSLALLRPFCAIQKKISGIDRSLIHCFLYSCATWTTLSLFAASLSYFLLVTKTGSYYFLVHFFIVIPAVSLLSSLIISRMKNQNGMGSNYLDLGVFLCSFSLFTSFIYMGLKVYLGS